MIRNTAVIEGMACGMCESHIADTIRRTFPDARKVRASHTKNTAVFLTEEPIDEQKLKAAIEATGYHYRSLSSEPVEKKGLFHRN
jgi:copper chaperone